MQNLADILLVLRFEFDPLAVSLLFCVICHVHAPFGPSNAADRVFKVDGLTRASIRR